MSDLGSRETIDNVYTERNLAVAALYRMSHEMGYKTCYLQEEPGWVILLIELPTGQVSWHIPIKEFNTFFPAIATFDFKWDGHSGKEKNIRLATYAANAGWEIDLYGAMPQLESKTATNDA